MPFLVAGDMDIGKDIDLDEDNALVEDIVVVDIAVVEDIAVDVAHTEVAAAVRKQHYYTVCYSVYFVDWAQNVVWC